MKSEKGITLLGIVLVIVVLMMITAVTIYVVIGPNGVLNREEVEPISTTEVNEVE